MRFIFSEKNSDTQVQLNPNAKHVITAKPNEVYQLIDTETNLSPLDIKATRKSDDLILSSKEQELEVVIKDFWEECKPGEEQCYATLNVLDQNGVMGEVTITQDGPVLEHLVAGETGTLSDNEDGIGLFLWAVGSIGSALAIFLANRNHGGDNKGEEADVTAPSKPGLTAEDDGSVSIDLPKDANKGDSVDVTFEDEDGNSNTVTLEKGDNGWISSNPDLIPDTDNDKVTIPNDKIKDNSDVTASAKDPSGNKSDEVTVTAKPDPVTDMPVLSIPEVADGFANADELKDGLQAEVTLPTGTVEGAEITLTITRPDNTTETVTHTVTKDDVVAGKVSIDIPKDAVQNGQNSVDVSLTQGSNPAKPGNKIEFAVDTQIPGDTDGDGVVDSTPVVTIPEAANGVNAEELKDGVQTEVTVPGGSAEGDTLTLTITKPDGSTETVEHTLTADEVTAGKADVTIPADKVTADGKYTVTAEITDPAGNSSGKGQPTDFTVDTQIPGDTDGDGVVDSTPVVTIPEAANGVNAEDLKDGVQTEVTVPGGSAEGDTLTLTITKPDGSTETVEHTLTADEVTAGKADVTIPADKVTADGKYTVTAEITDPAGNTSGEGKPTDFTVDTVAPSAPELKAEDDGSVSVKLPDDANKGDTVEITFEDENGDKQTVTMEKGDNGWTSSDPNLIPDSKDNTTTIPSDNVKDNSEVTATAKDPSGNESDPATVTSKTDGVTDAPVLNIPEVADGYANADELKDGLQAEVTLPAGTVEGAEITLTITRPDKSTETVTHAVTKDEVTAGKVSMDIPKDAVQNGQNSVDVSLTQGNNPAKPGNKVEFAVDGQIPGDTDGDGVVDSTPVVTIPEAANGVNAEDLKDGVQTEVTVPGGSAEGDTLTLTITKPDGSTETVEHTLTADEVTAGKADVTIPADKVTADGKYTVTAEITDPAGNTSGKGQPTDFTVDTVAPSAPELKAEDDGSVSVKLPDDANKGDTVEITFEDENGDKQTVTMEKGDNGWTSSDPNLIPDSKDNTTTIPSDNVKDNSEVTATAKDPSGNESDPATVTSKTDGVTDAPVLNIPEVADGYANADELKDGLQAEVTLPAGTVEGAEITLTITRPDKSTETVTHTVTKDEVTAGKVSMDIPKDAVQNGQNSVDVSLTQGNNPAKPGNKVEFAVDGQIPGDTDGDGVVDSTPVVTIPEAANGVNAEELKDGVQTEVTVPGGSAEGDTLTLTITKPDGSTDTVEHTLTADEVAAGKAEVTIPADKVTADGKYTVTAEITDPAGNSSGKGQPTDFTVDTQIPGDTDGDGVVDSTPVVTIPEAANGVNAEELKDGVQTEVTVPGGSAEGDTLTLTITKPDGSTDTVEHTLTADEVAAGKADVTIPADKVTADGKYAVTAEITDPAGNTSGKGQPTDFTVDTVAPSAPVLKAEDDGSVSVELPKDANKGDTVEITFEDENGDKHTVTLEKGDNGWTSDTPALIPDSNGDKATIPADNVKDNSEVTATAKDPSGNESDPATVTSKTDGVTDAPVLNIPEVADGYANADELKDGLQAEVTLPAGTVEGAEITLTITRPDKSTETVTHAVTKDEVTAGKVSMDIPKDAVQNGQNSVDVSLTQGSNPAKPGNKVEFAVDGQIPGDTDGDGVVDSTPVVTIPEAANGVNAEELKDGVQTEVTVPGGSAEGDTLTLTITKPDGSTDTVEHTLTADEVAAGKAEVTIPADKVTADGKYTVTAEITDPAGNTSGKGQPTDFTVDTQIPGDTDGDGVVDSTPVVTIPEAANGVNAEELKDGVQTEVTVPGGSAEGDTLTLTITKPDGSTDTVEHTLTADEVAAGKADVTIPADKATPDGSYSVKAEITDPAGNTSGEGKPTDFTVDTVAPSAPVLNAEDNGSVSVELPKDANKGDTVEITFEDENGDKQTVTMEKGDNGWTSSDPNLIPDSNGDSTTIPYDNVKDNSEVTAVAKDPSGNESDPATATSKTDVLPTVSISVETTSTDDKGDKIGADASVSGEVIEVPATIEDNDDTTGLVYTVALDYVATQDVTVTVTLTNGAGYASAPDYSTLTGSQHDGKVALHGDTGEVTYDGASTVTVVIPAGSKSVSFIVDPTMEANQNAFNAEGMEKVVATITGTSDNATAVTDTVNNAGASATGVIYDGNPISLRNLDGDFTLKYSLSSSVAEGGDFGYTIGVNSGKHDPMVTTNYNDTLYVGYYQDGMETSSYSNVASSLDGGADAAKTDGSASITTVDLGAGDDLMVIRGNMLTNTRIYAGEGKDTFTMDGMNTAMRVMYSGSYLFMESGDDTVTIKRTGNLANAGQIYLGSGSDTYIQGDATTENNTELSGLLDLGSGTQAKSNLPKEYLSVYQDGSNLSLGNDNNIDAVTDVNTVTIYGSVSGEILGGYGSDNITVTKNLTGNISVGDNADTLTAGWIYGGSTVSMGDGNDTVTVTDGAYNATISLGAGDDVFDSITATLGSAATTIDAGEGNDIIKLGTISNGNIVIDAGAGDDTVVLTKDYDSKPLGNQGYIKGGEGSDTLVLTGTISVNLASSKNEGITGFEKVDMTVGSDLKASNESQLVKLTVSDVLGMNANSTIYISGDANDKVDLGADGVGSLGTFTATATTVKATALDGTEHTYTLYSSTGGANVYIDNNIIDNGGVF